MTDNIRQQNRSCVEEFFTRLESIGKLGVAELTYELFFVPLLICYECVRFSYLDSAMPKTLMSMDDCDEDTFI